MVVEVWAAARPQAPLAPAAAEDELADEDELLLPMPGAGGAP